MSAVIRSFSPPADRLRRDQAEALRQALLPFIDDPAAPVFLSEVAAELLGHVDRRTASSNRWTFVMLSPSQNAAVVRFINRNAARPRVSTDLWAMCFEHLRMDSGEVLLSRAEFAKLLKVPPREVSRAVSELVEFGALSRRRDGQRVRYFMNPTVATHLSGAARDAAQAAAPILKVIDGTSHPSQRRCRVRSLPAPVL